MVATKKELRLQSENLIPPIESEYMVYVRCSRKIVLILRELRYEGIKKLIKLL